MEQFEIEILFDSGLIQFGRFQDDGGLKANFQLLPSYPNILRYCAALLEMKLKETEFLVGTADSVALATTLSQRVNKPLVYAGSSSGVGLIGAYDVGHSAVMIMNRFSKANKEQTARLIAQGERIGLSISHIYCIFADFEPDDFQIVSLISLESALEFALKRGFIRPEFARHVQAEYGR